MTQQDQGKLLIYAPVPVFRRDGALWAERQAVNGLRLWAAHFDHVTVMMPLGPGQPPAGWVPLDAQADALAGVTIEPLPMAYRPDRFLRELPATRARIRALIERADYLSFAIGGLFGDWGAAAALTAHRMGRRFAVWTDRVESEVTRRGAGQGPWRARLRARLTHRPMAALERAVIRRATLGLFHGRETFDHYARYSTNPQMVHNIHLAPQDHIAPAALAAKQDELRAGAPLRLLYVGRADPMKGPLDWVAALAALRDGGVAFTAQWLGDGPMLEDLRGTLAARGLEGRVQAPGFADDRAAVLAAYRAAHLFLFCHKTPESPRCLIEALASGTALAGYEGAYACDLLAGQGGGVLVPIGEHAALAAAVAELDGDRARLADLIGRAAQDGAPFTDEAVFRHRSELIKAYL